MKRGSSAVGKPAKPRVSKRSAPKHRNASKAVRNRAVSIADQQTEVSRLTRELQEGQGAAEGDQRDPWRHRSRTDVQSVPDTVCRSAAQLCQAYDASVWRTDGDQLLLVAHYGPITQIESVPLVRGSVLGRSVLDMRTVHILDLQTQGDEFPVTSEYAGRMGFRTGLYVPLLREGVAIGVIALRRAEAQLVWRR